MSVRRFVVCAFAASLLALAASGPPASAARPGGGGGGGSSGPHDPILFVHGWNSSSTTWNTMVSRFQKDGWTASELNNWSYNTAQSNKTTAAQIQTKVDQWVSLGGPNHGTDTANFCFDVSCGEMRIGSQFLSDLNAGDETPGLVNYGTWWSPCDSIINPDSSVSLIGATNTRTACVSHTSLPSDATIYAQVRDFVK